MAARAAAAGRPGGGAGIQALRPARARLVTGAGALAALGGVVAYSTSSGGPLRAVALATGAVALVLLALGLVLRLPALVPWAILLAGGGYLAGREHHAVVDGWAAVVGVALLLCAELADWSIRHDRRIRAEPSLVVRRVLTLTVLVVTALLVDLALLATAAVATPAGVVLAAAGVVAAVASVAIVLRLLRA
jgi:hypothetical protein